MSTAKFAAALVSLAVAGGRSGQQPWLAEALGWPLDRLAAALATRNERLADAGARLASIPTPHCTSSSPARG